MRKTITENGIEYRLTGDYYLPHLALLEEPNIGGQDNHLHRIRNRQTVEPKKSGYRMQ